MKEFIVLICVVVIAASGYAFFIGRSNSINFRYNCDIHVPWYDAFFLNSEVCPGNCQM